MTLLVLRLCGRGSACCQCAGPAEPAGTGCPGAFRCGGICTVRWICGICRGLKGSRLYEVGWWIDTPERQSTCGEPGAPRRTSTAAYATGIRYSLSKEGSVATQGAQEAHDACRVLFRAPPAAPGERCAAPAPGVCDLGRSVCAVRVHGRTESRGRSWGRGERRGNGGGIRVAVVAEVARCVSLGSAKVARWVSQGLRERCGGTVREGCAQRVREDGGSSGAGVGRVLGCGHALPRANCKAACMQTATRRACKLQGGVRGGLTAGQPGW